MSKPFIQRELHRQKYWRRTASQSLGYGNLRGKKTLMLAVKIKFENLATLEKCEMIRNEMTIVVKPDGKIKVWRKTDEKWKGFCLEYLGQGAAQI